MNFETVGQILSRIKKNDFQSLLILLACVIYALFGSPTPDHFGMSEATTGLLLIIGIGPAVTQNILKPNPASPFWYNAGQIFLLYGLSIPIAISFGQAHTLTGVFRDIIPFLFLFLPLFLKHTLEQGPNHYNKILWGMLIIGMVFSLRAIGMQTGHCYAWCTQELLYLENMPTVLLTALLMLGFAFQETVQGKTRSLLPRTILWIALAMIPLTAMAMTLQRASLGSALLYVLLILGYVLYKRPSRTIFIVFTISILAFLFHEFFIPVFHTLSEKTRLVGMNMRTQELNAVWQILSQNPLTFLFGIGWGGSFHSPAVNGLNINFTHNFFTFIALKTGLVGSVLALAYMLGLLEQLSRIILKNPLFGLALTPPFLIDLLFYASYKSLDFGLTLLMISGALIYWRQSESIQYSSRELCDAQPYCS